VANSKVLALTAASTPLAGAEAVYVVQGGLDRRTTAQEIANLAQSGRTLVGGFDGGTVNAADQSILINSRFELRAPFALTATRWTLLPKQGSTGDATVEIRQRPFSSGSFTAITASAPPDSVAGARATAVPSGWTVIGNGNLIEFEVTALSGFVAGLTLIVEAN